MLDYIIHSCPVYLAILSVSACVLCRKYRRSQSFATQRHSLTSWFSQNHTTLDIKDHIFFVEHQIDFKFSGSNVMLLIYYKTIPCFSGDEQTVRNYVYFFKTSFKKVIFFGLLRVPMMTLPRQPVFSVSMVTFLSFFYPLKCIP